MAYTRTADTPLGARSRQRVYMASAACRLAMRSWAVLQARAAFCFCFARYCTRSRVGKLCVHELLLSLHPAYQLQVQVEPHELWQAIRRISLTRQVLAVLPKVGQGLHFVWGLLLALQQAVGCSHCGGGLPVAAAALSPAQMRAGNQVLQPARDPPLPGCCPASLLASTRPAAVGCAALGAAQYVQVHLVGIGHIQTTPQRSATCPALRRCGKICRQLGLPGPLCSKLVLVMEVNWLLVLHCTSQSRRLRKKT